MLENADLTRIMWGLEANFRDKIPIRLTPVQWSIPGVPATGWPYIWKCDIRTVNEGDSRQLVQRAYSSASRQLSDLKAKKFTDWHGRVVQPTPLIQVSALADRVRQDILCNDKVTDDAGGDALFCAALGAFDGLQSGKMPSASYAKTWRRRHRGQP